MSETGMARNTDPETSHLAAENVDATGIMLEIYEVMKGFGSDGCISDDIEMAIQSRPSHSLRPRYAQMVRAGMIEVLPIKRLGRMGSFQQVRRVLTPPFVPVAEVYGSRNSLIALFVALEQENKMLKEQINALIAKAG